MGNNLPPYEHPKLLLYVTFLHLRLYLEERGLFAFKPVMTQEESDILFHFVGPYIEKVHVMNQMHLLLETTSWTISGNLETDSWFDLPSGGKAVCFCLRQLRRWRSWPKRHQFRPCTMMKQLCYVSSWIENSEYHPSEISLGIFGTISFFWNELEIVKHVHNLLVFLPVYVINFLFPS